MMIATGKADYARGFSVSHGRSCRSLPGCPKACATPSPGLSIRQQTERVRPVRPSVAGMSPAPQHSIIASKTRMVRCHARGGDEDTETAKWDKTELMGKIKSYGIAGTLSYIITGEWLTWGTDKAQLLGIAAGFVTVVRFAVPLRMAAALAMTPTVDKLFVQRYLAGDKDQ